MKGSWNPKRRTGPDLGEEDKQNKLEELKVFSSLLRATPSTSRKSRNGVKVTKTVVGAIQVGQNPRHVCLTEVFFPMPRENLQRLCEHRPYVVPR